MTETDVSRSIRKALELKRCRVIRIQSGSLTIGGPRGRYYVVKCAPKGTPDLLVIREPAVYTWLEIKAKDGKLSPEQRAWHEWAISMGLRVAVVRTIPEAIAAVFAVR